MSESTDRFGGLPLPLGAGLGICAYAFGYLLTYVLAGEKVRQSALTQLLELFSGEPSTWKVVGWLFYNAHLVKVVVPGFAGSRTVDLIAQAGGSASALYLLPPLALALAGAVVAHVREYTNATEGAKAGATVVGAYLPLALLGAFVFSVSVGETAIRPNVVTALFLAGLVYPALFGAVGGAIRAATAEEEREAETGSGTGEQPADS